jgi:uncharacterized membrane protein YeaQ/YmgE (transglycosylase-associated protein family)
MDLIVYLIFHALSGLVVGALGRQAQPGPDPMTILQTILLGIAASFIAGLIWWAIFDHNGGGILLSVVVAALIVYLIRRSRGGTLTTPGG